ncbi:9776_t:CDS:2, partial [Funneliformis caledonium]
GVDQKVAKNWEKTKMSDVPSINVQNPTILESGSIYGGTNYGRTINGKTNNMEAEHDISNEMVNEKGEIVHWTEKHKRDESPRCLNCDAEINITIFRSIRFCPFCGTNIISSEDKSSPDYDDTDEENDAIPDNSKMRLSTGTIVEDVLFKFAKDMDYEHYAHSYIVDFDDEDIKALFDEEEWKELTKDRIGVLPVPHDIAKELTKSKWHCNLYENVDAPLIRSQYEDWFIVALFGATDAPSLSSANRKNRDQKANTHTRKLVSRKIDEIIYTVDKLLEVGAIEGARSYSGVSD